MDFVRFESELRDGCGDGLARTGDADSDEDYFYHQHPNDVPGVEVDLKGTRALERQAGVADVVMPNLSTFKASDKTVWSRHEPVDAVSLVDMMEQALHDPCHPRAQEYRLLLLDMHGLTEQGKEMVSQLYEIPRKLAARGIVDVLHPTRIFLLRSGDSWCFKIILSPAASLVGKDNRGPPRQLTESVFYKRGFHSALQEHMRVLDAADGKPVTMQLDLSCLVPMTTLALILLLGFGHISGSMTREGQAAWARTMSCDNLGRLHGAHGRPGLVHVLTCCLKADPAERWAPGRVLGDYQLWTEKFKLLKLVDALGLLRSQNENKVLKEELQHWLSLLTKAPFKLPYAELMANCITGSWRLDVGDGMHGLRNIFTHIIDYLLEDPTLARAMAGANLRDASIQDT